MTAGNERLALEPFAALEGKLREGNEWTPLRIKSIREVFSLSQAEFAEKLGTSKRTVARWESGKAVPSPSLQLKLEELAKDAIGFEVPYYTPDEIRDIRENRGWTQEEFAAKIGATQWDISRWETGECIPSTKYRIQLAQILCKNVTASKPNPASPLTGSLYQSKENYAWTKEAIQSFRRVQGWTQQKLATEISTTQQIVAQWETGKFSPDEEHQLKLDQLANFLVFQRQSQESELNALQNRLNALDIPYELFKQYTKLVASRRWQYIIDKGDGWFEAKRTKDGKPWPAPYTQIADHLAGHVWEGTATRDYIFQTQPSSFAVGLKADYKAFIVDIDLDKEFIQHPGYDPIFNPGLSGVNVASGLVMYERMQAIVELFPESLVLRRPESGNLSVIFRIVPIPTWKMLKLVEKLLLVECDLEIKDGEVELFQRQDRARRLPFNGAQAVIEKESMPWKIRPLGLNKRQDLSALVNLPMIDLEAKILDIAPESCKPQQSLQRQPDFEGHFKCVPILGTSASPFVLHCLLLLKHGLTKPKSRHAAETDLILYFFLIGRTCEETYKRISFWYQSGKTNGYSKDWANHPQKVLRDLRTHVKSYYRWLDQRGFTPYMSACDGSLRSKLESERSEERKAFGTNAKPQAGGDGIDPEAKLSLSDVAYIAKVTGSDLHFGEWLFDLFVYAKQRKFTLSYLYLSQRIMQSFKNGSHNYREYVDRCLNLDLLTLKRGHVSKNFSLTDFSRPKVFQFNYNFQDIAPLEKGKHYREALSKIFNDKQIRARFEKKTAQRILSLNN